MGYLARDIQALEAACADWVHLDVMDGQFVPNLSMGPGTVAAVRQATSVPLDVHLMVHESDRLLEAFTRAGANWIAVHAEACTHLHRTLQVIRSLGCHPGVALNPATAALVVEPVLELVDLVLVPENNPGFSGQAWVPGMALSGQSAWVGHIDGALEQTQFPADICANQPVQPFAYLRAICHLVLPGVWAEIALTGDIFEMEDQRRWTDASYKNLLHTGGEALLQKRSVTGKKSENERDVRKSKKSNSQRKAQRLLPRIRGRLLELDGQVEWGPDSDREVIHRCIHGVSGHIHLLPQNWTPSAGAKGRAAEFGVMLPANSRMTFVQPHIRGRSQDDSGLQPRAVIKAKALATLSALDLKSRS